MLSTIESMQCAEFFSRFDLGTRRKWYGINPLSENARLLVCAIEDGYVPFRSRNGQCRVIARPKWRFELEPKQAPLPSEWLDELVHANIIAALPKTTTNNKIGWYDLGFTHAGQYYLFIQ